jgi:hypothetical protein
VAENEFRQKRAAEERHRDAQERANQEVFREALGFEFRIAGDGFLPSGSGRPLPAIAAEAQ